MLQMYVITTCHHKSLHLILCVRPPCQFARQFRHFLDSCSIQINNLEADPADILYTVNINREACRDSSRTGCCVYFKSFTAPIPWTNDPDWFMLEDITSSCWNPRIFTQDAARHSTQQRHREGKLNPINRKSRQRQPHRERILAPGGAIKPGGSADEAGAGAGWGQAVHRALEHYEQ